MAPDPDAAADFPWADPPLIGLHDELELLTSLLAGGSALGLVRGELGPERRSLLVHMFNRAGSRGWRTAVLPSLRPDGSCATFIREVRELLGVTGNDQEASARGGVQFLGKPVEKRFADASGRASALMEALALRPTLLVGDNYDASPDVEAWLLDEFLPEVRAAGAQTVVLVAGRAECLAGVAAHAAVTVDAGPPSREQVRQHLDALGRTLATPFDDAELDILASEAASAPTLIPSLIRVLGHETRKPAVH